MAGKRHRSRARGTGGQSAARPAVRSRARRQAVKQQFAGTVVGIGASAGGLEAFSAVLGSLRADTGMSFVFISHLDPTHESILTSLLARTTSMPVVEANHGTVLEPDHVYVIPRNARMTIGNCVLSLTRRLKAPAENLPIDHFMRSLARDRKHRAVGVILSGTASDGTIGLTMIKSAGGITIVQDPGTAKYDGMPRSAIRAAVADFVLPPKEIAAKLVQIARNPESLTGAAAPLKIPASAEGELAGVFDLLRERTGADFTAYKEATVRRRVRQHMALRRTGTITDFLHLLRREPAAADGLFEDLLIKVTGFFRDPKTFEKLKTSILPSLLKKRSPGEPIRVWVPGCSTGEEAYSIAMLFFELMGRLRVHYPLQIFATDLSEKAIAVARIGIYPESIADSVSPARRRRFFVSSDHGYRVTQRLREACVFSRQDLTKDPPFSRVDLVSCRNVLIYLRKTVQDRILPMFHYALKPNGFLLLGKSETIIAFSDLFGPVERTHRIFRRKPAKAIAATAIHTRPAGPAPAPSARAADSDHPPDRTQMSLREEANRMIVKRYATAGVVINGKMEILEILGDTHPYLRLSTGTPSLSLARLVRRDLALKLRAAVDLAKRKGTPIRREAQPIKPGHGEPGGPTLEIIPMTATAEQDDRLLVLFDPVVAPSPKAHRDQSTKVKAGEDGNGLELTQLRAALADSQEHLRLLLDGQQTVEEELKSANEELMSNMEELQSANEELQTSHEELESTNEELTTVNDQLDIRNRDLTNTSNDLTNLFTSVNLPILILTSDLRVRRSNTAAYNVLGLTPADVGRPLVELRHTLKIPTLVEEATRVLKTLESREIEVQDRLNVWHLLRLRPYRTEDDRSDGLVVVLSNVDSLKRSLQAVERARKFSRTIVEAVREPLLVLDGDRHVLLVNRSFLDTFHMSHAGIENRSVYELKPDGFRSAAFRTLLEESIKGRGGIDLEVEFSIGGPAPTIMAIDARRFDLPDDGGEIVLLTMMDITRFRHAEQRLVAARDSLQKGRLQAESSLRETKQDLRSSRAELRILAGRLIRAQEEERKRVARELHDHLSQRLSALHLGSAQLIQMTPKTAPARGNYEIHQEHIAAIVEDVRRLAYDLHPAILTHLGLRAALQSFCVEFSAREGIDIEFSAQKEPSSLNEEVALCLYRVTQESLRNVAKHSGCKSASVSLRSDGGDLHLSIKDGGKGFDVRPTGEGGRLGLLSMRERVRLVNGTIQVRSRKGLGTQVDVRVPLAPAQR